MIMESEFLDGEQLLRAIQNLETELAKTLKRCEQVVALAQQHQNTVRGQQDAYLIYLQSLHTRPERSH